MYKSDRLRRRPVLDGHPDLTIVGRPHGLPETLSFDISLARVVQLRRGYTLRARFEPGYLEQFDKIIFSFGMKSYTATQLEQGIVIPDNIPRPRRYLVHITNKDGTQVRKIHDIKLR